MDESAATPKLPAPIFRSRIPLSDISRDQLVSSSPGFGTPAYPIATRPLEPAQPAQPFASHLAANPTPTVLSIRLPSQDLRLVAVQNLNKHGLLLETSGLDLLATFVGKYCGTGWREGLAARVLNEVANEWKRGGCRDLIIEDGKRLTDILKTLEPYMVSGHIQRPHGSNSNIGGVTFSRNSLDLKPGASREDSRDSLGISGLDVEDSAEADKDSKTPIKQDARSYLKVISAFEQPRLNYSTAKKSFEKVTTPLSLFPPISHKIAMFRNRYNIVHQRLMRNESFQNPTLSTGRGHPTLLHSVSNATTIQQAYKITPISNLLGRSGTFHLLLGLLVRAPTGDIALTDLSGSVALHLSSTRSVPEGGAWFCPGMIVLVEGMYDEDGSNNSSLGGAGGVGGQIKGRFIGDTIAGPPAERRDVTVGIGSSLKGDHLNSTAGVGFGWVDFLGVGSEKAVGEPMRRVQKKLLGRQQFGDGERPKRTKIAIAAECHLDDPRTLDAIHCILESYYASENVEDIRVEDIPLTIVLMGNFVSAAAMDGSPKGGDSREYKKHFDALSAVLAKFQAILCRTTFVFVPGDNDPWASTFSAGAASLIPKKALPNIFTSRVQKAITNANSERDGEGEAIFATNPSRISLFGPVEELVLIRDDMTRRLRRSSITLYKPPAEEDKAAKTNTETCTKTEDPYTAAARKLVKTILDQGHLAPFPISTRPVHWDYASSLWLYPLPTALVLADAEAAPFAITYEGCHVMNPGRVIDEHGGRNGIAKWVEYDVVARRAVVKEVEYEDVDRREVVRKSKSGRKPFGKTRNILDGV